MMDTKTQSLANNYDEKYRRDQYFKYREWLYRPLVKALVRKAKLKRGCSVLDVGCGQGFFSWLFADLGLKAVGIDISAEAVRSAEKRYGVSGARFEVGEFSVRPGGTYDCVFVRSLSAYNTEDFRCDHTATDALLTLLSPGGVLIFDYNTKLSPKAKSETWNFHSVADVRRHFSSYPGAEVYFLLRIETLVLGSWAFRLPLTRLSAFISQRTGIGGELIAFVRRSPVAASNSNGPSAGK
jgi:SAM-dependent methyltransferase